MLIDEIEREIPGDSRMSLTEPTAASGFLESQLRDYLAKNPYKGTLPK